MRVSRLSRHEFRSHEHVWHHTPHKTSTKGPGMFTGMVDLTRDQDGRVPARLLDLAPGRAGKELSEATLVLDAFHLVKFPAQAMDEVRRRVQQDTLGHRGRAGDPLYRVRNILHRAAGELTERQWARLVDCLERGDRDDEVLVAWQCYQQVRSAYAIDTHAAGEAIAEHIVATFKSCPITEIARLGRTLRQWKGTCLGYVTTGGANNGGTEAVPTCSMSSGSP